MCVGTGREVGVTMAGRDGLRECVHKRTWRVLGRGVTKVADIDVNFGVVEESTECRGTHAPLLTKVGEALAEVIVRTKGENHPVDTGEQLDLHALLISERDTACGLSTISTATTAMWAIERPNRQRKESAGGGGGMWCSRHESPYREIGCGE
jgi:hypothetical protein